ncbi:pseudouridine synthase [Auriscalpium vulgare]|uniref:Pseudouridine synthase n=1 Tax=Auriscalpium vulgare TaxID=40419 RepID=A0ACB8RTY9_9AGAM|nr:pseudouridine synthase [Auriscalpium vulgare]
MSVVQTGLKAARDVSKRAFKDNQRHTRSSTTRHEIYVDRSVIVLNKPPGLAAQRTVAASSLKVADGTDFDGVLKDLRRRYDAEDIPFPVHRLDKSTTGALVLARTKAMSQELSQQFHSHDVNKSYLALVRGGAKTFPEKAGEIDGSMYIDDGRVSLKPSKDAEAKRARTGWEVLASSERAPVSLLRFQLHTGVKHQLRVHAASVLKAPILGDSLYGSPKLAPQIASATLVPEGRMFLHASSMSLIRYRRDGPHKRFRLGIVAPLPRDFVEVCRDLDIDFDEGDVEGGVYVDGERVDGGKVAGIDGAWVARP